MAAPTRKFSRIQPEMRREHLVEATLRCLAEHGHAGVSVRKIAAAADVSIGLINHYYPSIDQLISHAYETLSGGIATSLLESSAAGGGPRDCLSRFINESFGPAVLDPDMLGVWVVFWSMVRHSHDMQTVQQRTYGQYRQVLERHLGALAAENSLPPQNLQAAATALNAMLDGLWLTWCLNPSNFSVEDGVAMCEGWVDAFAAGAFVPRLKV
ncbi:TetR/AcrR family transcriptional regulator [Niveispirillum sp. KHB5.9]|uniref:TetR/AcrR family transcriptional regulator n=1 Tax=Niveispirillum sp. KHB5.9 TaxID=3400269 RepID=UPI003A8A5A4C